MGLGGRYIVGVGFCMPVTVLAFPITMTTLAAFAAFTTFALAVSRGGMVPWALLGVVGGPWIVPMIGVCIHLGLLVTIWLSISGET